MYKYEEAKRRTTTRNRRRIPIEAEADKMQMEVEVEDLKNRKMVEDENKVKEENREKVQIICNLG